MARLLKKGDQGFEIKQVQTLLMEKGYLTDEEINGVFDNETYRAVRLFQSQNLDQNGQPLTVDGKVGELTWCESASTRRRQKRGDRKGDRLLF